MAKLIQGLFGGGTALKPQPEQKVAPKVDKKAQAAGAERDIQRRQAGIGRSGATALSEGSKLG